MTYVRHDNAIVEELPDGVLVDPFLMCVIRHHADTEEERADMLRMCCGQSVSKDQLAVLLKYMGNGQPLLMQSIGSTSKKGNKVFSCRLSMRDGNLHWDGDRLSVRLQKLPETVMSAMVGRPLKDVIAHPYYPQDLEIASVKERDQGWMLELTIPTRQEAKGRPAR